MSYFRLLQSVGMCSVLMACTSTSVLGGDVVRTDGLGSDLRVFLDDQCVEKSPGIRGFGVATLSEIAVGVGNLAFNSFGRFLEEAGLPDVTTSSGLASDYFYEIAEGGSISLNPDIQCIHIVRGGFEPSKETLSPDEPFAHLNLTSKPSFYALVQLDTGDTVSPYFRGNLEYFIANRFERAGGETTRDISIAIGFALPSTGAGENFSIGAIDLAGVERGRIFANQETNGLSTGWLGTPPASGADDPVAFNLYVDVVESKRGNPFLVDLGRTLQSAPVVNSLDNELSDAILGSDK